MKEILLFPRISRGKFAEEISNFDGIANPDNIFVRHLPHVFLAFFPNDFRKRPEKTLGTDRKKTETFSKKNTKSFKFQGLQEGTFLNIIAFVTLSYEPDNLCNKKIISTISIILIAAPIKKNMRKESIAYHHAPIGNQLRALCNPADPAALTPFCRRLNS